MSNELMRAIDYTPTTDVVRHAVTFPRLRLGEPRNMTPEAFDRWLADIRREARAEGWDRREDDLTSTLNPYRDHPHEEEP